MGFRYIEPVLGAPDATPENAWRTTEAAKHSRPPCVRLLSSSHDVRLTGMSGQDLRKGTKNVVNSQRSSTSEDRQVSRPGGRGGEMNVCHKLWQMTVQELVIRLKQGRIDLPQQMDRVRKASERTSRGGVEHVLVVLQKRRGPRGRPYIYGRHKGTWQGNRDLQSWSPKHKRHRLAHSARNTLLQTLRFILSIRVSLKGMAVTSRTSEFHKIVNDRAGHIPDAKRRKLSAPSRRSSPESEKQELLNKEYVKEAYNVVSSPSCSDGMLKYTSSSPFGS